MAVRKAAKTAPRPPRPVRKAPAPLDLDAALAALSKHAAGAETAGLQRFGIVTGDKVLGVGMKQIQALGRQIGSNHALAEALWNSGVYEARMLSVYVANPVRVTSAQMERQVKQLDNWAVCDTLCFSLWDRTPHAWDKVVKWARARDEYVKRASFALLAALARHDAAMADRKFLEGLKLVEAASGDERNFVKKGVLWALRAIGTRNATLKRAALALAKKLAASDDATQRWIGKTAIREMAKR